MNDIDYRKLLHKYMQHIVDEESIDYLYVRPTLGKMGATVSFTDEEWAELKVLSLCLEQV